MVAAYADSIAMRKDIPINNPPEQSTPTSLVCNKHE